MFQSHESIVKAAFWLGIGSSNVYTVPTEHDGSMTGSRLQSAINRAREDGKEPFYVNATAGTAVFGAFDNLNDIAEICESEGGLWFHVDVSIARQ